MNKLKLYSLWLGLLIGIFGMPVVHADPAVEKTYIEQFLEKNPTFKQYFEFEAGQEIDLAQKLIDLETAILRLDYWDISSWQREELFKHFQKSIYEKLEKKGTTSSSISYLRRIDALHEKVSRFYASFFKNYKSGNKKRLRLIPKIIDDALKAEVEESRKGKVCLYHGTSAHAFWNFLLYTEMWKVRYQRSLPDDFLFLRFLDHKTCDQDGISLSDKFIDGRSDRRHFLVDNPYKTKGLDAQKPAAQLSTNYSLFSHWDDTSLCALHYAYMKGDGAQISDQDIPQALAHFYSKEVLESVAAQTYLKRVDAVREKFEDMRNPDKKLGKNFGALIQLSIDPKIVDNIAYVAKSRGKPGNIRIDGIKNPSLLNLSKALMNPQEMINVRNLADRIGTIMVTPDVVHTAMKKIKMRFFTGATDAQMKEVRSELNGVLHDMENAVQGKEKRAWWKMHCKTMDQCMKPKSFKL